MVDNCYGEFTDTIEPGDVGADLMAGSLIKNPGGGLAPSGGYIAGRADLVEKVSYRLTVPGVGGEAGAHPGGYLPFYQGLFMAPHAVAQALKTAALAARAFEKLGFDVSPPYDGVRSDTIQAIRFPGPDALIAFVRSIQAMSPVDSAAVPEPWDMPGYRDPVIMAAGTFIAGSSIELSADAPVKPPYTAYLQGSLTYAHGRLAIETALKRLHELGYI
jgi:cystathionine beta-lyase family protein involved in aluminum resistance